MSSYIGQVRIGETNYPVGSMLYGECPSTVAASTAAKTVTMAAFDVLSTGVTVHVKFVNGNTAGSPTLKVGSTDAKSITNPNGQLTWATNSVLSFTYDGTTNEINPYVGTGGHEPYMFQIPTIAGQDYNFSFIYS